MGLLDRLRSACAVDRPPVGGTTAHAVTRIEYDRTPDPAWQAALDAQHIPGTARLYVAWEPGDVWQPIHRWFLWQLQPWHLSENAALKDELRGPHPRRHAVLEYRPMTVDGVRSLRPYLRGGGRLIDRRQWEIHREVERTTGALVIPRRLWVIQGDDGGHPFTVSSAEAKHRAAVGLSADVPSAAHLPYAPFDRRVLVALERYDLWRFAHGLADPLTAGAAMTLRRMHGLELDAHKALWGRFEMLGLAHADRLGHAMRADGWHRLRMAPVTTREDRLRRMQDPDAVREHYLTDTSTEAVA